MSALALHRQSAVALADLAGLAIATTVVLLLAPRYSYNGAAVAVIGAQLCTATLCAAIARRASGGMPPMRGLAKSLAAGAMTAGSLWLLRAIGLPWPVGCGLGGVLYVALLVTMRAVSLATLRALAVEPVTSPPGEDR